MKPVAKRLMMVAGICGVAALALVAVLLGRTLSLKSVQMTLEPALRVEVADAAIERLAGAVRIATVSSGEGHGPDPLALVAFHRYLERAFPALHGVLEREVVGEKSLLFTWRGGDKLGEPILLLAHMDVVPVEPGTEAKWAHGPFAGDIADGFVWGRGTLDDKVAVMAILEAVEMLVKRRPRPGRTIVLAFGHDEEIGGVDGAGKMAAILKARDDHFEYVLDEGAAVTRGIIPGLKPAVALVGIAEKGSVSVELSAISPGGHSSMPPPQTAAGIVAAAVTALESNPMAAAIDGPMAKLFDRLAPEMPFFERLALSNRWLFGGLITRELGKSPTTNAALRTTTAATILEAGVKENVLPAQARAVVNFRIKPGDTIEGVLKHVTDAIGDRRVNVKLLEPEWAKKASRESSIDSRGFKTIEATIRQVMPDVLVAPSLVVGATDTRHYEDLADEVYRFLPVVLSAEDTSRIHGTDERISVEDYKNCVRFYVQLLTNEGAG
jgi:carboxypeptidase PM20D1